MYNAAVIAIKTITFMAVVIFDEFIITPSLKLLIKVHPDHQDLLDFHLQNLSSSSLKLLLS